MSRRFLLILLAISSILLLNFGLIAYFEQQQQIELLHQSERGVDNQLWQIFQLGSEFQRVREATRERDLSDLTLRFDIFYGRVKGLEQGTTQDLFVKADRQALFANLHRFLDQFDHILSQSALSNADWQTLQASAVAEQDKIDDLLQSARVQFSLNREEKNRRLERLGYFRMGLSALQATLLLIFAAVCLSVLWRNDKQKRELLELNRSLSDARQLAEAATAAKSRFLAHISHEIRTPLTSILGYSERLRQNLNLSEQQKTQLGHIAHSGQHLLSLLNHVLDLSKSENGKIELVLSNLQLEQLKLELESMFALMAQDKALEFEITLSADLPPVLQLDAGKLRQILINLIGNSMKFTEKGRVSVQISGNPLSSGYQLIAMVDDSGCGIAEHELEHLFHPFEQTESGKHIGGTGLGLALSRDFARLMSGDITAQSQLGRGSRFIVSVLASIPAPVSRLREVALPAHSTSARGQTILVVEDQAVNRDLLCEILQEAGTKTLGAENGLAAIECIRAHPEIDRVLMDYQMPGLDGLSTTAKLRENGFNKPIYLITATPEHELKTLPQFGQLDGYLSKPYQIQDLLNLLGLIEPMPVVLDSQVDNVVLLDQELARQRLGFNQSRYETLAHKGFVRLEGLESDYLTALKAGEIDSAQRHAHSAKGIALQIGAFQLAQLWSQLEESPQDSLASVSVLRQSSLNVLKQKTEH